MRCVQMRTEHGLVGYAHRAFKIRVQSMGFEDTCMLIVHNKLQCVFACKLFKGHASGYTCRSKTRKMYMRKHPARSSPESSENKSRRKNKQQMC